MKAAVCREFGKPLSIEEINLDKPQSGEISVDIKACAICHSDIHFAEGAWGGELPMVFGHEAAGIVSSVGDDVRDLAPGDHVVVTLIRSCGHCSYCDAGMQVHCEADLSRPQGGPIWSIDGRPLHQAMQTGAFAEQVNVHASQAVAIPHDLPFASASLLACGVITGFGAVTRSAMLKPGQSAVIIGCGGVGLNALQGARLSGAQPIIAIDLQASKREIALEFGATHVIDPQADDVAAVVKSLTRDRGVDHVLVTVGATATMESGLQLLAAAGVLTVVGMPPAGAMARYEAASLTYLGQRIQGSVMGSSQIRRDIPALIQLYQAGRLKLDELVTNRYPLGQINEAIKEVKTGQVLRNVIVFD